jgi:hypothetical protein|tara:strand:- start:97 stop:231 length:135 start_codon:yes stop_codon:yes gene_type:complete
MEIHSQILADLSGQIIIDFTVSWYGRSFVLGGVVISGMSTTLAE